MSISDERGLNFDRNAAILLKSRFFNKSNEHENSLFASFGLEIHRSRLLSFAQFTQTIEQTIVSVCTPDFLAFFSFSSIIVVCKQVERLPKSLFVLA